MTILVLAMSLAQASECPIKVKATITLPQGEAETPASVLEILTQKGYSPEFTHNNYISAEELLATATVTCLHTDFNPELHTCATSATITNAANEVLARHEAWITHSNNNLIIRADDAFAGLPDCSHF